MSKVIGTEKIQFIIQSVRVLMSEKTLTKPYKSDLKMQGFKISKIKNYIQDELVPYITSILSFVPCQNSVGKVYCV